MEQNRHSVAGRGQAEGDKTDRERANEDRTGTDEKYMHRASGGEADKRAVESTLAVRVLEACRNQLFFRQRFLEQPLFRLKWVEREDIFLGNDGEYLYYDKTYILKRYLKRPGQMAEDYLHTVMHCLYQHPFCCPRNCTEEQEMCWNLAADMAVECVLEEMRESEIPDTISERRNEMLERLKQQIGFMSVQKLFSYLQKNAMQGQIERIYGMNLQSLCRLFQRDDHRLWYTGRHAGKSNVRKDENRERQNGNEGIALFGAENKKENSRQQIWKKVAERVLMEAQTFAYAGREKISGSMLQHLKKLTRETYDYTKFLMKFATHWEERMQIDEDEFDYTFYTYGMKLFGKVPLIEPLEYKEKNLIREFLVAIDTSGSCQGEVVERFLTKTYNILRQIQAFASRVIIYIVQCDARIQEDTRIESQEELEAYIACLTLKGFGGTAYTPVFEYADRLLEAGEIRRLDGLLYFTDGYGTFPAKPPKYRTAFVFLNKEEEVTVPPWAMKVYLDTAF